jgi:hypothetical protein
VRSGTQPRQPDPVRDRANSVNEFY